jgi:hypothetical protein
VQPGAASCVVDDGSGGAWDVIARVHVRVRVRVRVCVLVCLRARMRMRMEGTPRSRNPKRAGLPWVVIPPLSA